MERLIINRILICIFALTSFGCSVQGEDNVTLPISTFDPVSIEPTLIRQHRLYGNGQENISKQNFVIRNQSQWNGLLEKMDSVFNSSNGFTETDIDFDSFIVIAVFDEVFESGVRNIEITEITEYESNVVVKVVSTQMLGTSNQPIQPYHIVKIPKILKDVVFE
ncbi:MAG TPA: hypothetical protein VGB43_08535 [Flavobacterium sp.]|jgi:hypothetical protein